MSSTLSYWTFSVFGCTKVQLGERVPWLSFSDIKIRLGNPFAHFGENITVVWDSHVASLHWLSHVNYFMMTSSNGNIFRVTGPLCGWISRTTVSDAEVFFICARMNDWVNNREAGDLRRHRGHYDVSVMTWSAITCLNKNKEHIHVFRLLGRMRPAIFVTVICGNPLLIGKH